MTLSVSRHVTGATLGVLLLAACSTPDPVNLTGKNPRTGNDDPDGGTIWDGSFEDDAGDGGQLDDTCGEPPVSHDSFSRAALLGAAADCAAWHHCRFESAAASLHDKARALADDANDDALHAARLAWHKAMLTWSELELFQFGPVAPVTVDEYHGKGIRNLIYAWPRMSRCQVEEQIALQRYLDTGVDKVFINARGLFASEYLFFYPGSDTSCSSGSQTASAWSSLSEDELSNRKRGYAAALADDILKSARELVSTWDEAGLDFKKKLVAANGYGSDQEALNVIAWSLVYLEREVKDWKLGIPAGYTATAPIDGPESPFAGVGTENIRANLRGFRSLFQGCGHEGEGIGFDDWLSAAGHEDLASDILAAYRKAQDAADAFPPLHEASAEEIDSLYWVLKELADLLKADLFGPGSPLNLKLPATVEGDTD